MRSFITMLVVFCGIVCFSAENSGDQVQNGGRRNRGERRNMGERRNAEGRRGMGQGSGMMMQNQVFAEAEIASVLISEASF